MGTRISRIQLVWIVVLSLFSISSCSTAKIQEKFEGENTSLYLLKNGKFLFVYNMSFYSQRIGIGSYYSNNDSIVLNSSISPDQKRVLNKLEFPDSTQNIILYDVDGWPIKKEGLDYFLDSSHVESMNWNDENHKGKNISIVDNKYGFVYSFTIDSLDVDLIEVRCEVNYGNYLAKPLNYMIFDSLVFSKTNASIETMELGVYYLNGTRLIKVEDKRRKRIKKPFVLGMTDEEQEFILGR